MGMKVENVKLLAFGERDLPLPNISEDIGGKMSPLGVNNQKKPWYFES